MVLEDVFSDENLEEAFESFADKHDSHGLDGVKLSELRAYWETNGKKIKESIFNGTYPTSISELDFNVFEMVMSSFSMQAVTGSLLYGSHVNTRFPVDSPL